RRTAGIPELLQGRGVSAGSRERGRAPRVHFASRAVAQPGSPPRQLLIAEARHSAGIRAGAGRTSVSAARQYSRERLHRWDPRVEGGVGSTPNRGSHPRVRGRDAVVEMVPSAPLFQRLPEAGPARRPIRRTPVVGPADGGIPVPDRSASAPWPEPPRQPLVIRATVHGGS